jgi:hypothetical protein
MNRSKGFFIAVLSALAVVSMTTVSKSQQSADSHNPPGVQVVKFSWTKERVGWERDPFSGPLENFDEMRVRTRNEKRIQDAKRGGSSVEANKAERDALTDQALISTLHKAPRARYGFVYRTVLQNNNPKAIATVDWDYVFFDLATGTELSRRQFASEEKIAPGKEKELKFFIPNPPTKTVSVQALNKNERNGLGERIELMRVEYADGTIWERP